jgi:hypothetical protein
MENQSSEAKKEKLKLYLQAMESSGEVKPGTEILERYRRYIPPEETERERQEFVDWARDRHAGETLVLLGTGPSIRSLELSQLRRFTTLGCNGIGRIFQPDYYIVLDPFIYGLHQRIFRACRGTRILSSFTQGECDVRIYYRYENLVGLAKDDIYSADNSGYVQVSVAYIMGAQRIVLAGYDGYKPDGSSSHGYDDAPVERDRVHYEWRGKAGQVKAELIREAFACASQVMRQEGRELYLLTDSVLIGDLVPRISWEDFLWLPGARRPALRNIPNAVKPSSSR